MAAAAALRDAIATAFEGLAAGARPTYARSNKAYKRTKRQPGVGASSHRLFWFLPPKASFDQGQGPALLVFSGSFSVNVALNLAGLDLEERFNAVEQEGLLLFSTIKTLAHPVGISFHKIAGWDYTREDDELEDITLELAVEYTAREAV